MINIRLLFILGLFTQINFIYAGTFDIDSMKKGKGKLLNRNYFISTSLSNGNNILNKKICKEITEFIKQYNGEMPFVTCNNDTSNQNNSIDQIYRNAILEKDNSTPHFKYHYHIEEKDQKEYQLSVINRNQRDPEIDFKMAGYTIKSKNQAELISSLKRSIRNSLSYDKNNSQAKMLFLAGTLASKDSQYNIISDQSQTGLIVQDKKSKIKFGVKKIFDKLKNDGEKRNYLRSMLEVLAIYGFAGVNYILQSDTEAISAGFHYDWGDVFNYSKRVRFDDEGPGFNWGHSLAGMLVHTIMRTNNFNRFESFLATFFVSFAWENFFEYREVISINDQFFTPFAGAAIGEATHILCQKFLTSKKKNRIATKILSFVHNPFCTINTWHDGSHDFKAFDSNELSSVDLITRLSYNDTTKKADVALEAKSDIIDLPITGAGKIKKLILDPRIAKVEALGSMNTEGLSEIRAFTQVALAAYHLKNTELDENKQLSGYSFIFSLTSGTEFHSRAADRNEDWFGVANVLGANIEVFYFYKGIKVRMGINISGDIAMVKNYSYNKYIQEHGGLSGTPASILTNTQADFSYGHTTRGNISISGKIYSGVFKGSWELGASVSNTSLNNFNTLQRNDDELTNSVDLEDNIHKVKVYFIYGPKALKNVRFKLSYERLSREGSMFSRLDNLFSSDSEDESVYGLSVIYNYL